MKLFFRNSDKAYITKTIRRESDPTDQECVDSLAQSLLDNFGLTTTLSDWAIVTISNEVWDAAGYSFKTDYTYVDSTSITASDREETYYYEVTTDATDTGGPADGIPDIAIGGATCTITVTKKMISNSAVDTSATDTIYVTTSCGRLNSLSGDLVNGVKTFTLTSPADSQGFPVITAMDPNGVITSGSLQMQFK